MLIYDYRDVFAEDLSTLQVRVITVKSQEVIEVCVSCDITLPPSLPPRSAYTSFLGCCMTWHQTSTSTFRSSRSLHSFMPLPGFSPSSPPSSPLLLLQECWVCNSSWRLVLQTLALSALSQFSRWVRVRFYLGTPLGYVHTHS